MFGWPEDVPVLTAGDVTLRAHHGDDLEPIVEMCRDPLSQHWTEHLPDPYERSHAEWYVYENVAQKWRSGTARAWAVDAVDESGRPRYAGNIDLRAGPAADIGFLLHPWARGRGVMSGAVRLAMDWSFTHGGVDSVTWRSRVGNIASRRVAWAAGFAFFGTLPRQLGIQPPLADAWIGTVVAGDELRPRTTWLAPVVLHGNRIRLRPFTDADIPRIVEACSDPRTRHWLSALPDPYTEESARAYLDSRVVLESGGQAVTWCIADADTDVLLGNIAVFDLEDEAPCDGEIGYWSHPDARGAGIMTEAVDLLVKHAFTASVAGGLGLHRLQILTGAGNSASEHIARAAGFVEVGRERRAERLRDGSFDDLLTFDALSSDMHFLPTP